MSISMKFPCEQREGPGAPGPAPVTAGGWVLLVAVTGSAMTFIDSSAVTVALPSIQAALQADAAGLQWVIEGYTLFLSALILVCGSLGDRFGRRRTFIAGIGVFALASLVCAAAPNVTVLNLARCVQGVGGALATPGSLALISANFSGAARGRAIGMWSGITSMAAAVGPLLGGWFAQHASWRLIFLINVPLALVAIVVAALRVPESRDAAAAPAIDIPGSALITLALGAFTFGLIRLQSDPGGFSGIAAIGLGIVSSAGFVLSERRARYPIVPRGIFANRAFTGANVYTFLVYAALGGAFFFVPFNLQNVQGYTPTAAGGALLPFIVIMFVSSRWSGGLAGTIGARIPLTAGALVAGCGFLAYARIGTGGSYWTTFFPAAIILGAGGALLVAPLTTTVLEAAGSEHAGVASGLNNAVARVAGLIAIAALGIVLQTTLYHAFDRRVATIALMPATREVLARQRAALGTGKPLPSIAQPDGVRVNAALREAYTLGFSRTMIVCALIAWLGAIVAFVTIPGRPRAAVKRAPAAA